MSPAGNLLEQNHLQWLESQLSPVSRALVPCSLRSWRGKRSPWAEHGHEPVSLAKAFLAVSASMALHYSPPHGSPGPPQPGVWRGRGLLRAGWPCSGQTWDSRCSYLHSFPGDLPCATFSLGTRRAAASSVQPRLAEVTWLHRVKAQGACPPPAASRSAHELCAPAAGWGELLSQPGCVVTHIQTFPVI